MTTSIFIRSYRGDSEWLSYCLRSLEVHARGFEQIVVAVPNSERDFWDKFNFRTASRVNVNTPDAFKPDGKKNDYVGQMVSKLEADLHCSAQYLVFIDSDCVAWRDFTPAEFFSNSGKQSKPIQLIRHWGGLDSACQRWRATTKQLIGWEPEYEHMATLPLIYNRHTLRAFRDYLAATHHKVLWEYVKNPATHNLSEFQGLGAYAHHYEPQLYDWREANPETDGYSRPVHQHWSWGGIKPDMPERFEAYISGVPPKPPETPPVKLLLAIHSYPGANETVARHWPLYCNAGADEIIGVGTEDGGCVWPDSIRSMSIGINRYMDGKSDHLCRRLIETLEGFMPLEWDRLCVIEYDAVFFHPLPRDLPAGIVAHYAGGGASNRRGNSFWHCPWVFDRESAKRAIECGRQMIADGDIELGSPDCFIGRMAERFNLPISDCPFLVYSRNSLDIPWQLEEARTAVRNGAVMVHGSKTPAQLAALQETA